MKKERIEIRVTAEEKRALKDRASKANLSLSEWLIAAGLEGHIKTVQQADPVLIASIARIGNNINQIARSVNGGDLSVLVELQGISEALKALR